MAVVSSVEPKPSNDVEAQSKSIGGTAIWDWDGLPGVPGAFKSSHEELFRKCRAFVDAELIPNIEQWEEDGGFPLECQRKAYAAGVYGAFWPKEYGGTTPTAEEADMYHFFIWHDELARACSGGLYGSFIINRFGLPPILQVGNTKQKDLMARAVISAEMRVCLTVTEPGGGSDVANIKTTAVKDATGKFYIVNGQKTFISGGTLTDWFTTGVRTGGSGFGGISLLLIDRNSPGLKITRLKTQGWHLSSTTTISFEDVQVPVENLLGEEGKGFSAIMKNFNNERLSIAIWVNRHARCCIEDAVKYARSRKTFGKPLAQHQVIRHKIMDCVRHVMATHGMILPLLAQQKTPFNEDHDLAGAIALCKFQATKTYELVARECSQVFGGKAYLRSGPGVRVERCYREVRVLAIGGGSEEIMLDLASRQAKL